MTGSEIKSFDHAISQAEIRRLVERDNPVVLEVGCHEGSDSVRFLETFPGIRLHCFECDPRPIARFRAHIHDPRCTLNEAAVSNVDGVTMLHQSGGSPGPTHPAEWDYSSSILMPTGHLENVPYCTFETRVEVRTVRLDTWLCQNPDIKMIDFIWADVQGAEHLLIEGGRKVLAQTRFFYTEFSNRPLYAGQIPLAKIQSLLPDFELFGIYEGWNALFVNGELTRK